MHVQLDVNNSLISFIHLFYLHNTIHQTAMI